MGGGRYFQFLSLSCNRIPVVKGNLHIFSFSWLKIRLFIILQIFLHFWNGIVNGFSKFFIFWTIFFLQTFLVYNWKHEKFNFCKFANFLQILNVEHKSFHVSFVIFRHQTWDLEGGGSNCFQVPQQR